MPVSQLNDQIRDMYNLIWVGVDAATTGIPYDWDWSDEVDLGNGDSFDNVLLYAVFPDPTRDRLSAVMTTSRRDEEILYRIPIWSSRSGLPDYFVWGPAGNTLATGMFGAGWEYTPGR